MVNDNFFGCKTEVVIIVMTSIFDTNRETYKNVLIISANNLLKEQF